MERSISSRIKKLFFWTYTLSVLVVLFSTWLFLELMEDTMMRMDKQSEIEHLLSRHDTDQVIHIKSALLTLTYLPTHTSEIENLPIIFRNLSIPYEGEVEFLDKEYMVIIDKVPGGTFFLAKDQSLFGQYEEIMLGVLSALVVIAILLGYGLSILISRMVSSPVTQLTKDIQSIDNLTCLPETYKDAELNRISACFNAFLSKIDALIKRERSLITMASHELRTPVAVILGAAEVIEHRQQLQADDKKTLQRIISSAEIMSDNIKALLTIVRQTKDTSAHEPFSLLAIAKEVTTSIVEATPDAQERIEIQSLKGEILIEADSSIVRILLSNLINNGLNHNEGKVIVVISDRFIEVWDQAEKPADKLDRALVSDAKESHGLGLYIVTLICEQLEWTFTLEHTPTRGTYARILFQAPNKD
ncbi:sensor histidine kinase [Amphritea opalescens]|uniref:histidine kinase n=1 Tax=Amphritea opalescens TaxID=2490544 RepID=A0A430KS81_9GAMM|nr:HAMP domain-containing sensor histidine kinase [Amphritea opalescens]RTE66194.1 sensor histidine kinase [Amphritea opalescens]